MGNSAYGKGAYDTAQKLTKEFNKNIKEKNVQTATLSILSAIFGALLGGIKK